MVNKRINFTKKALDSLPSPKPGTRHYVYDADTRGLAVSVTDRGTKTFIFYRWIQGRAHRVFLGHYPDMSIEQARGKAAEHRGAMSRGENPADKRRLDRKEMTLQQLFDEYLERHSKPRKRTWKEDESKFKQYLATSERGGVNLAVRKLSTIQKSDIAALHIKIGKTHKVTANRIMILVSSIFGRAREWGLWEKENPCIGIRRYQETSRERFLQADELPRFFQALATEPNEVMRDALLMALLTGARRANVQAMRWDDITLTDERNEWRIPRTKSGESHALPLTPEAVVILERRREKAKDGAEFVFPGDGKTGHIVEPKKAWKRVLKNAKLLDKDGRPTVRIHDLRRTLGSWQAATGASLAIIGKTLAHKNVSTTAIYARLNLDPVRVAMEAATKAMMVAGGLAPKADVVPMRKKSR